MRGACDVGPMNKPENRYDKLGAFYALMEGWGESDPIAAALYIEESDYLRPDGNKLKAVLSSWATVDAEQAARFILSNTEKGYARYLENITSAVCREGGPEALFDWHENISGNVGENEEMRSQICNTVIKHLTHLPVDQLGKWVASQIQKNGPSADSAAMVAYRSIHDIYPESTVEYLAALAKAQCSKDALGKCIQNNTATDPDQIGIWLSDHPDDSSLDRLRSGYAEALKGLDPEAAKAWAETIIDQELRQEALKKISN